MRMPGLCSGDRQVRDVTSAKHKLFEELDGRRREALLPEEAGLHEARL